MRALIVLTNLIFGVLVTETSIAQTTITNMTFLKRDVQANDLSCVLQFLISRPKPPVCYVTVVNHTTNAIVGVMGPAPCLFAVELFDSGGKPIEKTDAGKKFGLPLSQEEIKSWWPVQHGPSYRPPFFLTSPIQPYPGIGVGEFSIPETFQLRQSGEYELHLRMRLIQCKQEASGQLYFSMIWLPEVTAKVQIRPKEVSLKNLLSDGGTNSSTQ